MRHLYPALAALLLTVPCWGGSAPLPVGSPFQINSYGTSHQMTPAVSVDAEGKFVVVWESYGSNGPDTAGLGIFGQRFSAAGAPAGSEFQINTYTTNNQRQPDIALDGDGDFVAVWNSQGSTEDDGDNESVQGRRYSADGTALGGQFQVNSYTPSLQGSPAVSRGAAGEFVVAWRSFGSSGTDSSGYSVQGQRYSSGGGEVGGEFQVNSFTTGYQRFPDVAIDADGGFVIVWESAGSPGGDTSSDSIQAQRFSPTGMPLGAQYQVNTYTSSYQRSAAVAVGASGSAAVVWLSNGSGDGDTSFTSIQGQRFSAGGATQGGQFQINTFTSLYQRNAAVAMDSDAEFVVVWESDMSSGDPTTSIQGQRFAADGVPLGAQFQVNSYTTSLQTVPAISATGDGDFVVVWQSYGSSGGDMSSWSIQGQRFRVTGDLAGKVFFDHDADGLQTGAEAGISGVTVELYDDLLALRRVAQTDGSGLYHLRPKEGVWHLRFVAPPAYFTTPNVGGDDTIDSDASPATGETGTFAVSVNALDSTIDAGFVVFALFWDGFESGDFQRWSANSP